MFGIAWSELLLIGIVALVVVPPKDLPAMMRTVGKWVGQMRRMASDFQYQVSSALRDAEIDDLKKSVTDLTSMDAMSGIREEIESVTKPMSVLAGQMREDLSIAPEIKSFPPGEPSTTPMSLEPVAAEDSTTPPGHAAFPGAMAEAHAHEAAVHDEVGERLAGLEPIPVHAAPLDAPEALTHETPHELDVAKSTVAAGSR
jgi:sec-independent protein translocase protein TatB